MQWFNVAYSKELIKEMKMLQFSDKNYNNKNFLSEKYVK